MEKIIKYVLLLPTLLIFLISCGDNIPPDFGASCEVAEDCNVGECFLALNQVPLPGGLCTYSCESHDDCWPGGLCLLAGNGETACFDRCRGLGDTICRDDWQCRLVSWQPWRFACVPDFED